MDWNDEKKILTEQLEILLALREKFGQEVIDLASQARLGVHQGWMKELKGFAELDSLSAQQA